MIYIFCPLYKKYIHIKLDFILRKIYNCDIKEKRDRTYIQKKGVGVMEIKQWDIVIVDFNADSSGSEQNRKRPAIVVQNNTGNLYSPTVIVIPLTSQTQKKEQQPTHALIKQTDTVGLKLDSMALCEQIRSIDKRRILNKVGKVNSPTAMKKILLANMENYK